MRLSMQFRQGTVQRRYDHAAVLAKLCDIAYRILAMRVYWFGRRGARLTREPRVYVPLASECAPPCNAEHLVRPANILLQNVVDFFSTIVLSGIQTNQEVIFCHKLVRRLSSKWHRSGLCRQLCSVFASCITLKPRTCEITLSGSNQILRCFAFDDAGRVAHCGFV